MLQSCYFTYKTTLFHYYENLNNYQEEGEVDNEADVNINYVHPHLDRWHPASAAERLIKAILHPKSVF